MKIKRFRFMALLALASMVLAACGGSPAATEQAPSTEAPTSGEKAKVVIFVGFGTGTDPDQVTAQEELAKKFNDAHEDIEMEFLIVPNEEATELLTQIGVIQHFFQKGNELVVAVHFRLEHFELVARLGQLTQRIDLLDDMKMLGFRRSTLAGLSFGITDIRSPDSKQTILEEGQKKADKIERNYKIGAITGQKTTWVAAP